MRLKKATKKRFFSQKNRVFKKPLEYNDIYPRHADFCSVPAGFMEYLSGCQYNKHAIPCSFLLPAVILQRLVLNPASARKVIL